MNYAETCYFDGDHSAHCAAWVEQQRLERILRRARLLTRR